VLYSTRVALPCKQDLITAACGSQEAGVSVLFLMQILFRDSRDNRADARVRDIQTTALSGDALLPYVRNMFHTTRYAWYTLSCFTRSAGVVYRGTSAGG
jgi:hypothetical protein